MSEHTKHAKLKLRNNDNFAPNEIAIVGTKCSVIADLVQQVSKKLGKYKLAYLDASHAEEIGQKACDCFTFHPSGTAAISTIIGRNKLNQRIQFSPYDLLFINGNHYEGAKQILILDNDKEASVLKRLNQLNNIQFVIKLTDNAKYFDFLEEKNPQIKNLPCFHIAEIDKISKHIENLIKEKIAPIHGLVLAGGKSTRMGTDKGLLNYHGQAQRDYLFELLKSVLGKEQSVFLSARAEQNIENKSVINDTFIGLGPFGALCSAFMHNPNAAYLAVATDVPFVNQSVLNLLISKRNPHKIATALKGRSSEFMEPLICIWEPKAYPILLSFLAQGYSCPRKVLLNSDVEIVEVADDFIRNINTPAEFNQAKSQLK